MKKIYIIPGLVLFIIGLFLAYDGALLGSALSQVGVSSTQTVFDQTKFSVVSPTNYSAISFPMTPQDSLTATIQSNPKGIDVLLMNQGNFTKFQSNSTSAPAVYPQSALNVSSYTLNFNETQFSGNFYLVFKHPQSSTNTDVLVRLVVVRAFTNQITNYLPIIIAVIGVILVALGLFSRSRGGEHERSLPPPPPRSRLPPPRAMPQGASCRYCGAAMPANETFCPVCKRSQA